MRPEAAAQVINCRQAAADPKPTFDNWANKDLAQRNLPLISQLNWPSKNYSNQSKEVFRQLL